jgi:hypothetical protein
VKCAFFLDEEGGCLGSDKGDLTFFENCRFAVQIDRKGAGDIITAGRNGAVGLCSEEFSNILDQVGKAYGYKSCDGMSTDVVKLKERGMGISAVNLSAGYYNQHKDNEWIVESELLNCLQFAKTIASFKTVFPHKYTPKIYASPPRSINSSAYPYNIHSRGGYSHGQAAVPHLCAECDSTLTMADRDEGLCRDCIIKFKERAFLEVSGNGEKKALIIEYAQLPVEDDIILPAKLAIALPADNCSFCQETISHIPEAASRGYCEPCIWCKCGQQYRTYEEVVAALCGNCLKSVDSGVRLCSGTGCKELLSTQEEINDGLCSECKAEILLDSQTV